MHLKLLKTGRGQSQDGSVGRCRVHDSPQLGRLPNAGGGPRHPRRWEEPPSNRVGRWGIEGWGEVEAGQDQRH